MNIRKWFFLGAGVIFCSHVQAMTALWEKFPSSDHAWSRHVVGDFTGDDRDDIASFKPSNGTWWVSRSTGSAFKTTQWADFITNDGWTAQLVGDFNHDGRDDIANFHPGDGTNGTWWVSVSTGKGFETRKWAAFFAGTFTSHVVGDFNGDGRDDVASFRSDDGTWWVSVSTGSKFVTTQWADFITNDGWTFQMVGDFNDDGLDDIANYYAGNGTRWVSLSTGSKFVTTKWAAFQTGPFSEQLVGDFDHDGFDDIASFRFQDETWWVSLSTGSRFATSQWWAPADYPGRWLYGNLYGKVVGDFNHDGYADVAAFQDGALFIYLPLFDPKWHIWYGTGAGFSYRQQDMKGGAAPYSYTAHLVGDYNRDGRDDFADMEGYGTWWFSTY